VVYAGDQSKEDGHIGISIERAWGSQAVTAEHIAANSPAAIAGIQEGDLVVSINGTPTKGMSAQELHMACLGPIGSPIKLTIIHGGSRQREISIVKKSLLDCYLTAATAGDPEAQFGVGRFYENHTDSKEDLKLAADWYLKSANQNYAPAESSLGNLYHYGSGVDKDDATAIKWFQAAAKQGDLYAERLLGWIYLHGDGVPINDRNSFNWFYSAATRDDSVAQYYLATQYMDGRGVNLSYKDAFNWFYSSAHQGYPFAVWRLAHMYEYGLGVTKDYGEALKLYQQALKQFPVDMQLVEKVAELSIKALFEDPSFDVLDLSFIHARFQNLILVITLIVALIYAAVGAVLFYCSYSRPDYQPRLSIAIGWIFLYIESQFVAIFTVLGFATSLTIQTVLQAIVIFGSFPVIVSTLGTIRHRFWRPSQTPWKTQLLYLVGSYLFYLGVCVGFSTLYHLITHKPLPIQDIGFMLIKAKHESFWITFLCTAVAIPMAEEIIFRGYLFDALKMRFSTKIVIGVTALIFASVHFDILHFIPLFTLGLTQGFIRYKTDSLRLPMLVHMVNNGVFLMLIN